MRVIRRPSPPTRKPRAPCHDGCQSAGPLHIELELPLDIEVTGRDGRARTLADVKVTNCPEQLEVDAVTLGAANSDTGSEMLDAIWKFAFPNLFRAFAKNEWSLSKDLAKEAGTRDLDVLVQAHWQIDHLGRNPDPDAALAAMAGTSLRQIKNVLHKPTSGPRAPVRPLTPGAALVANVLRAVHRGRIIFLDP